LPTPPGDDAPQADSLVVGAPGSLVGTYLVSGRGEVGGVRGVETILVLVVLGTVVAAFAGRLRVPAPSLLVIAGLVAGLLPGVPPVRVTPEVVSLVVLPPLLYAASEELPWRDLLAVWRHVVVLAVGLLLASAAAVAAVAVAGAVAGIPASMAFVLGAVLASTDPVAAARWGGGWRCHPRCRRLCRRRACSTTRPAWCCS
jgi:NhaP-type Na+/H+ or K+/H+ antiporter